MKYINYIKIISTLLVVSLISSCEKKENDNIGTVEFTDQVFYMGSDTPVDVYIKTSKPVDKDTEFTYNVRGEAVQGEDYTISSEVFTMKAGTDSTYIRLIPKNNYTEDRTVRLDINGNKDFKAGDYSFSIIPISTKARYIYTFYSSFYELSGETEVRIDLDKTNYSGDTIRIPFDVTEDSKALEGEHFSFPNGKFVKIAPKKRYGKVKVLFKKKEAGKTSFTIKLMGDKDKFLGGNFITASIKILGPTLVEDLIGEWKFKEVVNLKQLHKQTIDWGGPDTDTLNMPRNYSTDSKMIFTSKGIDADVKMDFKGDLAKYFRDATITHLGEETLYFFEGWSTEFFKCSIFKISKANVLFHTEEELRPIEIGMRILEDKKTLEIAVYDFEPKDFLQTIYATFHSYAGDAFGKKKSPVGLKNNFMFKYRFTKQK